MFAGEAAAARREGIAVPGGDMAGAADDADWDDREFSLSAEAACAAAENLFSAVEECGEEAWFSSSQAYDVEDGSTESAESAEDEEGGAPDTASEQSADPPQGDPPQGIGITNAAPAPTSAGGRDLRSRELNRLDRLAQHIRAAREKILTGDIEDGAAAVRVGCNVRGKVVRLCKDWQSADADSNKRAALQAKSKARKATAKKRTAKKKGVDPATFDVHRKAGGKAGKGAHSAAGKRRRQTGKRGQDARKMCRFFRVAPVTATAPQGCKQGDRCSFLHDWTHANSVRRHLRETWTKRTH